MCIRVEGGEGKEQGRLCPGSHRAGKVHVRSEAAAMASGLWMLK